MVHFLAPVLNKERFANDSREWFSLAPVDFDPDYVRRFKDFLEADEYNTTNYTLTLVGTGTVAVNAASNTNGLLVLTTTNTSADSNNLQAKQVQYKLETTEKPLWFESKVQVSAVSDIDFMIGLADADTTDLDATDRVVFRITNGSGLLGYEVSNGGTSTTGSTGITLSAATDYQLGFKWDGKNSIKFYVNRDLKAVVTTNIPTALMCETYHLKTNSANARTATIDYFGICKKR